MLTCFILIVLSLSLSLCLRLSLSLHSFALFFPSSLHPSFALPSVYLKRKTIEHFVNKLLIATTLIKKAV